MIKGLRNIARNFSGRRALIILLIIVVFHVLLMAIYLNSNRVARETVRRDAVIQKIVNAISLVEATPVSNREKAVNAMEDPDLHVSITTKPKWDLQFQEISLWNISKALRNNLESFQISIELEENQWLNLNATIYSQFLYMQLILLFLELMVLAVIVFSAWSISRYTQPLEKFKSAAEQLGVDIHAAPLDVKQGPGLVQELAGAMNQMQGRIQDLIRDRTQMLAAISHDLRTPITRMKLRLQFIDDQQMQDSFMQDLDEMEHMVNETMSFVRDDSREEKMVQVDMISLLETIIDDMQALGEYVKFDSSLSRVSVLGRPLALKRVFTNLINNGVRYAQAVQVLVQQTEAALLVIVEDEGPGIPDADLERVFEPFFRVETSRSRHTGGVGLGLAVVRDILHTHQASITLENRQPRGLRATIRFESL